MKSVKITFWVSTILIALSIIPGVFFLNDIFTNVGAALRIL